ncbi:hypothetical protein ACWEQ8_40535 [Streptomyces noursei]
MALRVLLADDDEITHVDVSTTFQVDAQTQERDGRRRAGHGILLGREGKARPPPLGRPSVAEDPAG